MTVTTIERFDCPVAGRRLLDIGIGPATVAVDAAVLSYTVTGIDQDDLMVGLAADRH